MKKQLFLIFLFLLLLIPSIYSISLDSYTCGTIFFNDSFLNNETYTSRGYLNIGLNCGNFPLNPVNSTLTTMDSYSFGHNTTDIVCGASHLYSIRYNLDNNITVGSPTVVLAYELAELTAIDNYIFTLKNAGSTVFTIRNFYDALGDRTSIFNSIGGSSCDMGASSNLAPPYDNIQFVLELDIDRNQYSAFYRNLTSGTSESYGCHNQVLGSFIGLSTVEYGITGKATPAPMEAYLDDIELCEAIVLTSGIDNETVDLSVAVATVWDDMGLQSTSSRLIFAMAMMVLFNLILFGFHVTHKVTVNPVLIIVLDLKLMILLVILNLLPVWIPIVLGLVGAGLGALALKRQVES